jgi:hypothetical protein
MDGMNVMRIGEAFSIFIVIKALWEMRMTSTSNFDDPPHKRAHIAALGAIAAYSLYDVFSFVWFEPMNADYLDYTISFFNIFTLNIIWLFVIDHFRQERKGDIRKSNWFELFKF